MQWKSNNRTACRKREMPVHITNIRISRYYNENDGSGLKFSLLHTFIFVLKPNTINFRWLIIVRKKGKPNHKFSLGQRLVWSHINSIRHFVEITDNSEMVFYWKRDIWKLTRSMARRLDLIDEPVFSVSRRRFKFFITIEDNWVINRIKYINSFLTRWFCFFQSFSIPFICWISFIKLQLGRLLSLYPCDVAYVVAYPILTSFCADRWLKHVVDHSSYAQ